MEVKPMSDATESTGSVSAVSYELALGAEEARQGVTKILPRNSKRLKVNIPPGVNTGSVVKLNNALQVTDGRPGDILIKIRVKAEEKVSEETTPAGVVEVDDNNFESEVIQSGLPVAVDFWAPWCGPCRMMAPIMEEAANQYQGKIKFCKINVDENPGMSHQYQAMSIPTLLFFKNGQVVERSVGAIPSNQLKAKLDALL
jgi:thioredoxin 1